VASVGLVFVPDYGEPLAGLAGKDVSSGMRGSSSMFGITTISMRRFCILPSSVALSCTGSELGVAGGADLLRPDALRHQPARDTTIARASDSVPVVLELAAPERDVVGCVAGDEEPPVLEVAETLATSRQRHPRPRR
jgi:hypothetical protein